MTLRHFPTLFKICSYGHTRAEPFPNSPTSRKKAPLHLLPFISDSKLSVFLFLSGSSSLQPVRHRRRSFVFIWNDPPSRKKPTSLDLAVRQNFSRCKQRGDKKTAQESNKAQARKLENKTAAEEECCGSWLWNSVKLFIPHITSRHLMCQCSVRWTATALKRS